MNLVKTFLLCGFIGGFSVCMYGLTILPAQGGTIPQGESAEQYMKAEREALINSKGFIMTLVGACTSVLTFTMYLRHRYLEEERIERIQQSARVLPVAVALPKPVAVAVALPKPNPEPLALTLAEPVQLKSILKKTVPPETIDVIVQESITSPSYSSTHARPIVPFQGIIPRAHNAIKGLNLTPTFPMAPRAPVLYPSGVQLRS